MAFGGVFHRNTNPWMKPLERGLYRAVGWPNLIRRLQWPHVWSMLRLDPDDIVVDLGAGSMQYSAELAKRGVAHVIAVDLHIPAGSGPWTRSHRISTVNADALSLPFASHSIDRILVSSLLQAVPDPDRMLLECRRVLKAEGSMTLIVPNHYRYLPCIYARLGGRVKRLLRLPVPFGRFLHELNRWFCVAGPQGYYSRDELSALLQRNSFAVECHRFSPGALGTLLWETGILLYPRVGQAGARMAFLFYPLAKLWDRLKGAHHGAEHVIRAVPAPTRAAA
jgi:SAM-dependent methyltransferase